MEYNLVMMPIKILYLNRIKLGAVLKITHLLLKFEKNNKIIFNDESYINDAMSTEFLQQFSSNKRYFEYSVKKYTDIVKIVEFVDNSDNITALKNDMFVGSHYINIETFIFLNQKLWPDLIQIYVSSIVDDNIEEGEVEIDLSFDLEELKLLYNLSDIKKVIDEFISDLSLYLTYNQIGSLILSKGSKFTEDTLELKMVMYI